MSMLNHMVVFRAALPGPGASEDRTRMHGDDQASRTAPEPGVAKAPQPHDPVGQMYASVAVVILACAITAGIVAVASII